LTNVDLPAPDGPTKITKSLGKIFKSTPSRAREDPYFFETDFSSIIGSILESSIAPPYASSILPQMAALKNNEAI